MTKYEIHQAITRSILSPETLEEEVLLYMALLHTHDIRLRPEVRLDDVVQADQTQGIVLPAITQRHAASVVASLWPPDDKRGQYEYWYSRYNRLTPYEVLGDVPSEQLNCVRRFRELLLCDSRVDAVIEA
jgi:hypothetical protein